MGSTGRGKGSTDSGRLERKDPGIRPFWKCIDEPSGNRVLPGSQVRIHDQLLSGVEHYEQAASLEPAAFLINSDGMVELCVCRGSVKAKLD